ncbi:MAG: hypothetical protein H7138_27505 [Myxococcales bacterium]|nr:hypothetical protein [Myxococcales bacterium]
MRLRDRSAAPISIATTIATGVSVPMATSALAILALLAGCGGGNPNQMEPVDAAPGADADSDAPPPIPIDANEEPPPPPTLGVQLDRAGRPGVGTLLLGTLAAPSVQADIQATYEAAADPATWRTLVLPNGATVERELSNNLAVFDGLDKNRAVTGAGCGNAMRYINLPGATSYQFSARLFADDQLLVDTQLSTCGIYFDLELFQGSSNTLFPTTCGGRTPIHDVFDMTYSVLAAGTFGVEINGRVPRLGDDVGPHADVTTTFPFLGAPR